MAVRASGGGCLFFYCLQRGGGSAANEIAIADISCGDVVSGNRQSGCGETRHSAGDWARSDRRCAIKKGDASSWRTRARQNGDDGSGEGHSLTKYGRVEIRGYARCGARHVHNLYQGGGSVAAK